MGEVERAQALLQAAGVRNVKVEEQAETVTLPLAEVEALRAGAAPEAAAQPAATPAASPQIPAAPMVPAPVAAAQPQGPQPPPGRAPLRTQADVEALSDREFDARYAEVQAVLGEAGR